MTDLNLPKGAIASIVADIRQFGADGLESGAMLLARNADPTVIDTVAFLGVEGIERRRDQLIISGLALATMFDWADERRLVVRAQLHSHNFGAFMSPTDERFSLTVEDFISVIVPDAADPSDQPDAWGWWTFTLGCWVRSSPARVLDGDVQIVQFDERDVHG